MIIILSSSKSFGLNLYDQREVIRIDRRFMCVFFPQSITLKSYPVELSLTAWICFMGTIEGSMVAVVMERGNPSAWSVGLNYKLLAAVYSVSNI